MTELNEIYKCSACGNIIEIVHKGGGPLMCCNRRMDLMKENTVDAATEKHIPVIEKIDNGITIKVGEVDHPMEDAHFIEWIEIMTEDGKIGRKHLKPGDNPEATFYTQKEVVKARAYCNLHGLWSTQ